MIEWLGIFGLIVLILYSYTSDTSTTYTKTITALTLGVTLGALYLLFSHTNIFIGITLIIFRWCSGTMKRLSSLEQAVKTIKKEK